MRKLTLPIVAVLVAAAGAVCAKAAELPHEEWSFQSIFGTYDRAATHRGFQIYKEICSNCHSLNLLSYRNLAQIDFSQDEIKQIAASVQVPGEPDDSGNPTERAGRPSDHFHPPFPNEQAARAANNGALPPDLSLMCKAREGGPDHIFGIMTGYGEPPAGFKLNDGMNYNKYFEAGAQQIAMPPPLSDGAVTFADGTQATVPQMAHDVATFLCWAAEPNLEARHQTGIKTILFLIVLTALLYAVKRKVWADVH